METKKMSDILGQKKYQKINELFDKKIELENKLEKLKAENDELDEQIGEINDEISDLEIEKEEIGVKFDENEDKISKLEDEISDLEEKMEELKLGVKKYGK